MNARIIAISTSESGEAPSSSDEILHQLRKAIAQMDLILASLEESVVVIGKDTHVVFANDAFANLLGQERLFLLGKSLEDLLPFLPRNEKKSLSSEHLSLLNGIYEWRTETATRTLRVTAAYLQKIEEGVLVLSDITKEVQKQELLEVQNRELVESKEEILRVNKELEAFSFSVSHDLRAPLRSVDGFSQALLEDFGEILPEQGKEYLRRVREGSQRMAGLIDDLLNLSRFTRQPMTRKEIDMSVLAGEVIAELRQSTPERVVAVTITPQLMVHADPGLLRAVLENLLGNAWKFTSKTSNPEITFTVMESKEGRVFVVRDNGAGFDMAYIGKLFSPFQRLHSVTEFPGSGVGLATVARIIGRHGGKVWAEGRVNNGAAFYFTLPDEAHSTPAAL